jgi:phosphonopyruvate decarboxylase
MTTSLPRLDRRRFVADLIGSLPEDALIVTGLGSPSYDVFAAGARPGTFYLWGAMGAAAPLALGLALAQPDRPVVAITGE